VHYTRKKSTRTRTTKQVHHPLALPSTPAAPVLWHSFPAFPCEGGGLRYAPPRGSRGGRARRFHWLQRLAQRSSAGTQAAPLSPLWYARAAPDGPEAAPYAGGAWTAGALVRVSDRHCAGRGQTPARAWRLTPRGPGGSAGRGARWRGSVAAFCQRSRQRTGQRSRAQKDATRLGCPRCLLSNFSKVH
jgi:hypothetical protein